LLFSGFPQHAPPDQVYSYIGMDPAMEVRLGEKAFSVEGEVNGKFSGAKLFPALKKSSRNIKLLVRTPIRSLQEGLSAIGGMRSRIFATR